MGYEKEISSPSPSFFCPFPFSGNLFFKQLLSRFRQLIIPFYIILTTSFHIIGSITFYLLSCHPHAENVAVRELTCLGTWEFEKLEELRWLKACICESMRLFPPVAWDSKHALANDVLPDGTRVGAGDRVTYFPYGMGRMKSLWGEDWFEFKPERWISEVERGRIKALKNYGPYKFPVFQAGPRACPGKGMAFVQMKYVVAAILKRFVIRPVVNDRPVFVPRLTAHMAGGFKVSVRRR